MELKVRFNTEKRNSSTRSKRSADSELEDYNSKNKARIDDSSVALKEINKSSYYTDEKSVTPKKANKPKSILKSPGKKNSADPESVSSRKSEVKSAKRKEIPSKKDAENSAIKGRGNIRNVREVKQQRGRKGSNDDDSTTPKKLKTQDTAARNNAKTSAELSSDDEENEELKGRGNIRNVREVKQQRGRKGPNDDDSTTPKKLKTQDTAARNNAKTSAELSSDDEENEELSSGDEENEELSSDDEENEFLSSDESSDSSDPEYPDPSGDKEPKDRSCPGCGEDFDSMTELSEHTCDKKPSKGFLCKTCGNTYDLRSTYVTHVLRHTNNTKKTRKCECGSIFYNSKSLFEHRCDDKRKRGFLCNRCDKYFKLLSTYINHARTHSRKKHLKCLACSYKTRHLTSYLEHRKGCCPNELPFPCDVGACEESFKSKKEVTRHKSVTHRSFQCQYCDDLFTNESTLKTHKKKEHGLYKGRTQDQTRGKQTGRQG